jgi:molecular chaperone DnaK
MLQTTLLLLLKVRLLLKLRETIFKIYNRWGEKQLKEYGDKLPADKKNTIEVALASLKHAHEEKNIAEIDSCLEKLNAAWTAASEDMYKQGDAGNANAGAQAQEETANADNNTTDVEFEEVK